MAIGHLHFGPHSNDARKLYQRSLGSERVRKFVSDTRFTVNRSFDIPYLSGSSMDGRTLYIDRAAPTFVSILRTRVVILNYIIAHERFEKALIDLFYQTYEDAHPVAKLSDHYTLTENEINPKLFEISLEPHVKADRLRDIKKVPPDLDLRPYRDSKDNKLLDWMRSRM